MLRIRRGNHILNGAARVTLMCGAGCEGAHSEVIEVARLLKAPIVHSLRGKDNGTLGFVELEMKAGGFVDVGCDLKNPNFAAMAEAMGIKGIRVEKPQDLKGALTEAFRHDGPALVDVVSARQELVMPPKTTVDEAYHFGMFMMKAVLDGRAHELIDLAKVNLTR